MSHTRNLLIVVSAPSGAGKTTLCERLLREFDNVSYSVSCTTRKPRGKERDGVEYHFLSAEEFRKRIAAGEFLEYATVHGHLYGTLRQSITQPLARGQSILMDIDVQGAEQVRDYVSDLPADDPLRDAFVDIFIEPPSLDQLRERLNRRGEDDAREIDRRVRKAAAEIRHREKYRYRIVNDSLEKAYNEFKTCVQREMQVGCCP